MPDSIPPTLPPHPQAETTEARLQFALAAAGMGTWEWDLRTNQVIWDPVLHRIFGLQPGEFGGTYDDFLRMIYPPDRARVGEALDQALHEGAPYHIQFRIIRADGAVRWRNSMGIVHRDELGRPIRMTGIAQDITERKEIEEKLAQSEGLYRSLVESLPQPIFRKDLNGHFIFGNEAFCKLLGVPAQTLAGKTDIDFFPDQLAAKYQKDDQRVIETGQPLEVVEEHRSPEGEKKYVEVVKTPLRDAQGKTVGVQGIFWDITERLNLQDQLRQAQKMETVGRLAGGVAHDFNNILTIIQGHASLLLLDSKLPEPVSESIRQISAAAERAAHLTRQLLTFSRRQLISPKPLDLNDILANLGRMLQRVLGEDIALQLHYCPSLPLIHADAGMLEQVLLNLAVNARDAMPEGGQLLIETFLHRIEPADLTQYPKGRAGQFAGLTVKDTGCGIPPENLPRLFEPFFTTKEVGKGTGLGLSAIYGIMKQHQGWIDVESQLQKGTTFKLFFPAMLDVYPPGYAGDKPLPRGTEGILVVEDEESLRAMVKNILQIQGYTVFDAASGKDALRIWELHQDEIDALLTDMIMPGGMSGAQLARRLQVEKPDLTIVYTSGYSTELFQGVVLRPGVNFLQKPYNPQILAVTIRRAIEDTKAGI